jgi:hypothetical protein
MGLIALQASALVRVRNISSLSNTSEPKERRMEIASVNFHISCKHPITQGNNLSYASFLKNTGNYFAGDIHITLESNNIPNAEGMKMIFDSGQSWKLFRHAGDSYISFNSLTRDDLFWIAKLNHDFSRGTVYCGDKLLDSRDNVSTILNPVTYPLDQIILMHYLASRQGISIHAAGIGTNDNGYIFAGRSGAGKTTISKQFVAKNYESLLSDDRVIVRKIDDELRVFGTPWPGEGGIASNTSLPLSGIFFLSHSDSNKIEKLHVREALEQLFPVVSIPWYDPEIMNQILSFCETLISHIPVYMLYFRPDIEVVDMIEQYVVKQQINV